MTQAPDPQTHLHAVAKGWAKSAAKQFRFRYPGVEVALYERPMDFVLVVVSDAGNFAEMAQIFHNEIRSVASPIALAMAPPPGAVLVDENAPFAEDLWLSGKPLTVLEINRVLTLISPNLPPGSIDFDHAHGCWMFKSTRTLSKQEKDSIIEAAAQAGMSGEVRFNEEVAVNRPTILHHPLFKDDLSLITSREMEDMPAVSRSLVQRDEDEWRDFLGKRAKRETSIEECNKVQREGFCCLYDAVDKSDVRLAELLTIYDQVDIIPDRSSSDWLAKHGISLSNLRELVELGRIRLVLPFAASLYDPTLIAAVAEVDSTALVLSRSLAAKTILHTQTKDPFLYAPLDDRQRAEILSVLSKAGQHEWFDGLIASYGRLFRGQHQAFMMRGANGSLGYGVGAHLGDLIHTFHKRDVRLELMTAGAAVEWSLGLGANYIPKNYGSDYDETNASLLIASFLGRTTFKKSDPVTNRMHTIVDGLLVASNVPPIEIAKNFHSAATNRFRQIAMRLMRGASNTDELQSAVSQINEEVRVFERRTASLSQFKLDALAVMVATKPVADAIDAGVGSYASIVAAWIYSMLKEKVPRYVPREIADASSILLGLATAPSLDAVIVSRSRKALRQ